MCCFVYAYEAGAFKHHALSLCIVMYGFVPRMQDWCEELNHDTTNPFPEAALADRQQGNGETQICSVCAVLKIEVRALDLEGQLLVASRVKPVKRVIRLVCFIYQMCNHVLDYLQKFNYKATQNCSRPI